MTTDKLFLSWQDEQVKYPVQDSWMKGIYSCFTLTAEMEQISQGEVSLSFVNDEQIRALNAQYRGLDQATDVLSFSMLEHVEDEIEYVSPEEETELLGDIVISIERAIEQAREYGHSIERELGFLFTHGFLHVLGYDHQTEADEQEMIALQESILQKAGLYR